MQVLVDELWGCIRIKFLVAIIGLHHVLNGADIHPKKKKVAVLVVQTGTFPGMCNCI